ncbi:hypothetical protein IGI39_004932 [Enterococcus sp. AZ135]|uniref:hypothetical protein n=1 Tax=unclassified Enterococcus TaxID=2608891 RepID=UPI003F2858F8
MSYRKDLSSVLSVSDCQAAYEKECQRLLRKYEREDYPSACSKMICGDFIVWLKAEERACEIKKYNGLDSLIESKW